MKLEFKKFLELNYNDFSPIYQASGNDERYAAKGVKSNLIATDKVLKDKFKWKRPEQLFGFRSKLSKY